MNEHIAHYSPRQGCEILSQQELAVEVLTACVAVGGVWVCMYGHGHIGALTPVSARSFFGEQNRKEQ